MFETIAASLTIGRPVKVSTHTETVFGHVVGFSANSTGETLVVVQVPKYLSPGDEILACIKNGGGLTVNDLTETFATHSNNVSII